jgi:cytochrome c oxidase subunit 2
MMDPFVLPQQASGSLRGQAEVFSEIFLVFLAIGTTVGIVVVVYTLYHGYKYRETGEGSDEEFEAPVLGELPTGQTGKSKKLFMSFGLSAIIVISVVVYSYTLLLYVESGPSSEVETEGNMDIKVTGIQFGWQFEYPNGQTAFNTMRVPAGEDQVIRLHVTSGDVWHNFGVTELRIKADAIPGETNEVWFVADDPGTYTIECFELCGAGHSQMIGEIIVMQPSEFNDWYEGTDQGTSSRTAEVGS